MAEAVRKPTELSPREREFVELVCRYPKPSPHEVAEYMGLSERTVDKLCTNVYRKLGVQNHTDMYHKAVQRGMVKCICQRIGEQQNTGTTNTMDHA